MKNSSLPRAAVALLFCVALWAAYTHGQPFGQQPAKLLLDRSLDGLIGELQ